MKAYVNPVVKISENGIPYRIFEVKAGEVVFGTYHTSHTAGEVAKAINRATRPSTVAMIRTERA